MSARWLNTLMAILMTANFASTFTYDGLPAVRYFLAFATGSVWTFTFVVWCQWLSEKRRN